MPSPSKTESAIASKIVKAAEAEKAGVAETQVSSATDILSLETRLLENGRLEAEVEDLKDQLKQERNLHGWRKGVLVALFILIALWLLLVVAYVGLSAMSGPKTPDVWALPFVFKLSDGVLIAFITSTTISVLGLFIIAAKWLFSARVSNYKNKG